MTLLSRVAGADLLVLSVILPVVVFDLDGLAASSSSLEEAVSGMSTVMTWLLRFVASTLPFARLTALIVNGSSASSSLRNKGLAMPEVDRSAVEEGLDFVLLVLSRFVLLDLLCF